MTTSPQRTRIVRRFLLLFTGMAIAALALVSFVAVFLEGRSNLPPLRIANMAVEIRQRRIDESWLVLLVRLAKEVAPLNGLPRPPSQASLEAVLAKVPEIASLDWFNADGTRHVTATRPGAHAVGQALILRKPSGAGLQVLLDREPLVRTLFGRLPAEPGVEDALLDAHGLIVARNPADAMLEVNLPGGFGRDANYLAGRGTLDLRKVRVHWMKEAKLGILTQHRIGAVRRGGELLVALGVLGLCLALAAWFAASYVTRPLKVLSEGAQRLAGGERGLRIEVNANDELGDLARDFNEMATVLQERESELKEKNAELSRHSDLKTRFLANVSHELRTPLTAIIGYCGMLRDGLQGPLSPGQRDVLDRVSLQASALVTQIDDLLDISKIEAGRLELAIERVLLPECLESAYAAVEPQLKARGLEFAFDLPADPPVVLADFQRLQQVFVNLLSNAVKFTEQGRVAVSTTPTGRSIQVRFTDTGIGIDPEHRAHIFEEFRQGDGGVSRKYGGTGLGLAISRRLMRLMDGDIAVDSQPGAGSTFTVTIPLAERTTRLAVSRERNGTDPS